MANYGLQSGLAWPTNSECLIYLFIFLNIFKGLKTKPEEQYFVICQNSNKIQTSMSIDKVYWDTLIHLCTI